MCIVSQHRYVVEKDITKKYRRTNSRVIRLYTIDRYRSILHARSSPREGEFAPNYRSKKFDEFRFSFVLYFLNLFFTQCAERCDKVDNLLLEVSSDINIIITVKSRC